MAEHNVVLSFDFASVSLWMAQGLTSPTNLSRGEFGVVGARRILDLLGAHGIKGSFYIPGVTINTYPDVCREIAAQGHEIGHHGYRHVSPVKMEREEESQELQQGLNAIATITDKPVAGYRSPAWDLSPHSIELLIEAGFTYDSSMMAHDHQPYFARVGDIVESDRVIFGEPSSLVELPISWSLDDFPHFEYWRGGGLQVAEHVMANWLADFRFMQESTDDGVLTYTFHPFVIGRGHRMMMLKQLIEELTRLGATFVTAEQAVARFRDSA